MDKKVVTNIFQMLLLFMQDGDTNLYLVVFSDEDKKSVCLFNELEE